jgi:hypothetical protein
MRVLPNGCKFNSRDYRREILEPFSEWRREQAGGVGPELIVHADNIPPHTRSAAASHEFMEQNGLERAVHPPYSRDFSLQPCGTLSERQSFETADELFPAIDAVLRGIEKCPCARLFWIGCRDSGNVLKPMVTISKRLKKVSWAK